MNILYIDCHDLGDWLGCYDKPWLQTPNLDRLAQTGARFTEHFATAPQCMPSRAGIYCGKLPHRCGVLQQEPLDDDCRCLARHLADQGWRTALLGHLNIANTPAWAGYQEARGLPRGPRDAHDFFGELAADDRPFFVHLSFGLVHRPYGQTYDPALAKRIPVPPVLPDVPATRRDLASLAHNVHELDRQVGVALDALDARGLAANTLTVFTTDHGVALGRHKHTLYDAGLHTALLMRCPARIAPGTVNKMLLSNVDLFPTVCELVGVPPPSDLDGISFADILRTEDGTAQAPESDSPESPKAGLERRTPRTRRTEIFAAVTWTRRSGKLCYTPHRCIRTARYKLIRNFDTAPFYLDGGFVGRHAEDLDVLNNWPLFGNPSPTHELYDCAVDPWEQHNLAGDPACADRLRELDARLTAMMAATGDPLSRGAVPSQTDEPVKPQWVPSSDLRCRLDYDLENETHERPFGTSRDE